MKRCTQCNRSYTDNSLRFCLDDGTVLVATTAQPPEPPATVLYSQGESPAVIRPTTPNRETQVTTPTQAVTPEFGSDGRHRRRRDNPSNRGLTVAVVAIGLVLIAIACIGVILLWRQTQNDQRTTQATRNEAPPPDGVASPGVNRQSTSSNDPDNLGASKTPGIIVTASSVRYSVQSNTYVPENVVDGSKKTAWIEGVDGPGVGEWLRFDFGREINLHRIVVLPGYFKSPEIWKQNNRLAGATIYFSNGTSRSVNFPDQMERQSIDLGSVKTRWVRLEIGAVYPGSDPDTAISEVVFEWEP